MKRLLTFMIGLALCGSLTLAATNATAQNFVVIGGGSTTGVYYQVALNICKIINDKLGGKGYNCIGRPALGSTFNIRSIQRGLLNYGVAQSDWVWKAANGKDKLWAGKPDKGLRTVFTVHPEVVMLVTRKDTGIKTIADLKGKRVNIGNPGSGQRGNAEDVLRLSGIDKDKDIKAEGLQQNEANRALVDKKIDAFFYTIGVPWGGGLEIANSTAINVIPVDSAPIRKLVADNPFYAMATIPGGTYKGVDKDVATYGVKATFVTGEKEPADSVYTVVKTIFENLDTLRNSYANFKNLQPKDMLQGLSAPLHPGAMKYYKEKGWQ